MISFIIILSFSSKFIFDLTPFDPYSSYYKFFFSFNSFSYLLNSLLALSWIKSHRTSKLYLYLIGFFSKSSATTVILDLMSSKYCSFSWTYWIALFFWASNSSIFNVCWSTKCLSFLAEFSRSIWISCLSI